MVPISLEVTKLLLESMHRLDHQRGGRPEPVTEPIAEPVAEPSVVFAVAEPNRPESPPDATQAIEGLALAEVMNPESPVAATSVPATPVSVTPVPATPDSSVVEPPEEVTAADVPP